MQSSQITSSPEIIHQQKVIELWSFGFKYGILEGDLIIDVRFLPNPFYDMKLRYQTGIDSSCAAYVFQDPSSIDFINALASCIISMRNSISFERKPRIVVTIGCTGGQHRSVAVVEALANTIERSYSKVSSSEVNLEIHHRDEMFWCLEKDHSSLQI